jgi:hypothetical protein
MTEAERLENMARLLELEIEYDDATAKWREAWIKLQNAKGQWRATRQRERAAWSRTGRLCQQMRTGAMATIGAAILRNMARGEK